MGYAQEEEINVETIFSKIDSSVMLHQIFKPSKNTLGRVNISPEKESLQAAFINLSMNQTFKPHKHILYSREMPMAQESWIVIRGKVKVIHYDLDDKIIKETILLPGECTITYRGGHNYLSLEENTLVYEMKTGPYKGIDKDKTFI